MSGFEINGLDEFMNKLEAISDNIDGAMEDAVQAGGEVMTDEIVDAVNRVTHPGRGYSTGALADSVESDGIKNVDDGKLTTIYPHGTDTHSKGQYTKVIATTRRGRRITRRANAGGSVRNYDKLWYLEHGTSKQAATPFMTKTVNDARPKVMEAMQKEIDAAIESAGRRSGR